MPDSMKTAPEMVSPEEHAKAGRFVPTCRQTSQAYLTAIWTELQKQGGRGGRGIEHLLPR